MNYLATVERQDPAVNEVAQLTVVGRVTGTMDECWKQAKAMTRFPVIRFQEIQDVRTTIPS